MGGRGGGGGDGRGGRGLRCLLITATRPHHDALRREVEHSQLLGLGACRDQPRLCGDVADVVHRELRLIVFLAAELQALHAHCARGSCVADEQGRRSVPSDEVGGPEQAAVLVEVRQRDTLRRGAGAVLVAAADAEEENEEREESEGLAHCMAP